jgi:multiple sugar transport system substrate-binding protein
MKKTVSFLLAALTLNAAVAQKTTITVAAFPAVDEIVKASLQSWEKKHPEVQVKVVVREYADHQSTLFARCCPSHGHFHDAPIHHFSHSQGVD